VNICIHLVQCFHKVESLAYITDGDSVGLSSFKFLLWL